MKWSRDLPEKPDFYHFRNSYIETIIHVWESDMGRLQAAEFGKRGLHDLEMYQGEWQPVLPPQGE